jgi:hypothetical protein
MIMFTTLKGDFTMTEHNHDSQLEINNEEELLTLFDEEGNEVLVVNHDYVQS